MPDPDPTSAGSEPSHETLRPEWEKVRRAFRTSIMVDTALSSLAQNVDGPDWPLTGADETPSKYIDLSYDELIATPGLAGNTGRVQQLITILRETQAFDDPFGQMVSETAEAADKDNPLLKNMAKLGISEDFPLSLVALLPETRDYCNLENLVTLRDFALFAQNLSQTVVVSGDFRAFLNALSHIDEATLTLYMPFRPGSKGLHLLEGIALAVRAQSDEVQAALALRFGARLGTSDKAAAESASTLETSAIEQMLTQQAAAYIEFFQADLASIQQQIDDGVPLSRVVAVLKNPILETVVSGLLKPYLRMLAPAAPARTTAPPLDEDSPRKKPGWFAKLFGRVK
ncbi:MAG: hypothetical protein QM790_02820 [Nibricoccus sp.]